MASPGHTVENRILTSPKHKLLAFFHRSRDQWKNKCKAMKVTLKQYKNQVRDVQRSRAMWRDRAVEARAQIVELKAKMAHLQKELGEKKISGFDRSFI